MTSRLSHTGRATAAALASVMLALSVAVPVLERDELEHDPVVESEHNPATCPPAHDHTICTQVGANASAPASMSAHRQTHRVSRESPTAEAPAPAPARFTRGHPSRAPPSA